MQGLFARGVSWVIMILPLWSVAQPKPREAYVWDKSKRLYVHAATIRGDLPPTRATSEKIVTALKNVWVMPTAAMPGHWRRARAGEVEARAKQDARYLYNIPYSSSQGSPSKTVSINNINENVSLLVNPELDNGSLTGVNGRMNVHYANTLRLGLIALANNQDHVLVVDTVYIPSARKLSNSFISIDPQGKPFLKLVAGTIIYESPVMLSLSGREASEFVFSSDSMYFKSVYENLNKSELQPAPPFTQIAEGVQTNVSRQYNGRVERMLLNRLYVKLMEQCYSKLSTTSDEWARDKLVERFQFYRYQQVKANELGADPSYQQAMNNIVSNFDETYGNFQLRKLREIGEIKIIADGQISELPLRPLKYFAIPAIANLQPLIRDSALGSVIYTGAGDADIKVVVETQLNYDSNNFRTASNILAAKGVILEKNLPQNILRIEEQPLKINGKTIGRIVPVSNQILRLEMTVAEGARSFAEWFPKNGLVPFGLDYKLGRDGTIINQQIMLRTDSSLLQKLDYTQPLKSFQVLERSTMTDNLKISSNVSATRPNEGALNYLEILAAFRFNDRSVLYGPYRMSAYNTLASELIIPFLKHADNYTVTISGRALYDNGEINIKPFESNSAIIALEDAQLDNQ